MRFHPQHQPRFQPPPRDKIERVADHRIILDMQTDQVGPGVGELRDLRQHDRVGHHQMHMDRRIANRPDRRDKIGKEQHRGGKVPVGNVDVQNVGKGGDAGHVIGQPCQIGRPHRKLRNQAVPRQVCQPGRVRHRQAPS